MAYRRNLFTGVLEEVADGPGGRQILYRSPQPTNLGKRYANPWDKGVDHICRPLSIPPEQATPERIAYENEQAKRYGTGASYSPDGLCHLPTRGSRAKEMRRPKMNGFSHQDNDAGYSDCAGR